MISLNIDENSSEEDLRQACYTILTLMARRRFVAGERFHFHTLGQLNADNRGEFFQMQLESDWPLTSSTSGKYAIPRLITNKD